MKKTVVIAVRISKNENEVLEIIAKRKNITKSELVRRIIRGYLKYKGYLI